MAVILQMFLLFRDFFTLMYILLLFVIILLDHFLLPTIDENIVLMAYASYPSCAIEQMVFCLFES